MIAAISYPEALFWAVVAVSGLIIGALLGIRHVFGHAGVAVITSFGAGLLLAAATVELAAEVIEESPWTGMAVLLLGAVTFSSANFLLERGNAKNRKRCGACVAQPDEESSPGTGLAIAVGTTLDAIPEALVLGLVLHQSGPDAALIAAIAIGNLPEALSASSGMSLANRPHKWILPLWFGIAAVTVVLTVIGFAIAGSLNHDAAILLQAFSAGALLALVAETMLPEATHDSPRFSGVVAALGFSSLLLIGVL